MSKLNALIVGTGEYSTGYVHGAASSSDKGAGVIALSLFELRRQGMIQEISMAGTNGTKFPGIRQHMVDAIESKYRGLNAEVKTWPDDQTGSDPEAYLRALDTLNKGDVVFVFTPDNTHFDIALAAINRGCHVLVAKPIVKTVDEHVALAEAAARNNVLLAMEVHKRWDPIYADARDKIRALGEFSSFSSYMSQPKTQLQTFAAWAGRGSDISYYLNSHHVDFNLWAVESFARPIAVHAMASTGIAHAQDMPTEDTITLATTWENVASGNRATAVYTSSWIAPTADVHSQQRFHYMGHRGEVTVDQAHRGYSMATDASGYQSPNPLFMKYTPDAAGRFAGQSAYGFRSLEVFVKAAAEVNKGALPKSFDEELATVHGTLLSTAILHAGRLSLDQGGANQKLEYDADGKFVRIVAA